METITIRHAHPSDHHAIISVMVDWWDGRDLRSSLPKQFLRHFSNTSFIAEDHTGLCGFLIGFLSPSVTDEGYIHFVGIHPD